MKENEWIVLLLGICILLLSGVVGALNTQYGFLDGLYKCLSDTATKCVPTSCGLELIAERYPKDHYICLYDVK